jgi:hypothetical protein
MSFMPFCEFKEKLECFMSIRARAGSLEEYVEEIKKAVEDGKCFPLESVMTGDIAQFTPPMDLVRRMEPSMIEVLNPTAFKFAKKSAKKMAKQASLSQEEAWAAASSVASIMQGKGMFDNGEER